MCAQWRAPGQQCCRTSCVWKQLNGICDRERMPRCIALHALDCLPS